MRRTLLLVVLLSLLLTIPTFAQVAPPSGSAEDTPDTEQQEEEQPTLPNMDESSEGSDESAEQGRGETSWERMNAEREAEVEPAPKEEPPESFSPVQVWRMILGLFRKDE